MRTRGHAVPSIHVNSQEDGFSKKREPFERKWHADDRACPFHEAWPEKAELEGKYGPRHRTDRKHDCGAERPPARKRVIYVVARLEMQPLGDNHQQRHRDPDTSKYDVKRERHAHLGTCG